MRKLFLLAVCCTTGFFAKAQNPLIDLHNNRPCTIYVEFFGDNGCGLTASSGIIAVPGGAHWNMLSPAAFGTWTPFTPADFTGARVYAGNPALCPGAGFTDVGETCTGLPMHSTLSSLDNACNLCTPNPMAPLDWNTHIAPAPSHFALHP